MLITSDRVRLRAIERADVPLFVAWFNDPEVTRYLSNYLPLSTVEEEGWYENMLKEPGNEHPLMIEAREGDEWTPIGDGCLFSINWRVRSAELGIVIGDKRFWNRGFGTQAMLLLERHGFETLNLNRIYLRVVAGNERAIRVYEKVGFKHEGCQRQASYKNGQYEDLLMMSILRGEWKPPTPA